MRLARCSFRVVVDGWSHSGLTVQEAEKLRIEFSYSSHS